MKNKKRNPLFNFFALFMAFLTVLGVANPAYCATSESVPVKHISGAKASDNKEISSEEITAFKVGFGSAVMCAVVGALLYFPSKEAYNSASYHVSEFYQKERFIKDFGKCDAQIVEKQQGKFWDWAACLVSIIKLYGKNSEISQKDIVKTVMGRCSFFENNRTESLPVGWFYDSKIQGLGCKYGLTYKRALYGLTCDTKSEDIKGKIKEFYIGHNEACFVINDSYFYGMEPQVHFVLVVQIKDEKITVEDPATGLRRTQDISMFCNGYIKGNGDPKCPPLLEMFTYVKDSATV